MLTKRIHGSCHSLQGASYQSGPLGVLKICQMMHWGLLEIEDLGWNVHFCKGLGQFNVGT